MFTHSEQLSKATHSLIEAQLNSFSAFAVAAFESGASVVDLNMDATRAALAAATVASNQMLSAREPQELLSLAATQSQQAFERVQAYGRQSAGLARGAHLCLSKVAAEAPLKKFLTAAWAAGRTQDTAPK